MDRAYQTLLIAASLGFAWLGMMQVHEAGHVVGAIATRGVVERVELPLVGFSRTDLSKNSHPAVVAWGGPLFGSLLPLVPLLFARRWLPRYAFLLQFFAGFCLIANGAYIGGGAFTPSGDTVDLLREGASPWQFIAFGIPAVAGGFALWNSLGRNFGLKQPGGHVDRRAAIASAIACALCVLVNLSLGLLL